MHACVGCLRRCVCIYAYVLVHFLSFDLFAKICSCSDVNVCLKIEFTEVYLPTYLWCLGKVLVSISK